MKERVEKAKKQIKKDRKRRKRVKGFALLVRNAREEKIEKNTNMKQKYKKIVATKLEIVLQLINNFIIKQAFL